MTGKRSGVLQEKQARPNSITKAKQNLFLARLAATCNVRAACRAADVHNSSIYALKARDAGFAERWERAVELGYEHLETELVRRALGGGGAIDDHELPAPDADETLPFDPELALKVLAQRHKADGQRGRSPARLKQPSTKEVLAALDRKLTAMEKKLERQAVPTLPSPVHEPEVDR